MPAKRSGSEMALPFDTVTVGDVCQDGTASLPLSQWISAGCFSGQNDPAGNGSDYSNKFKVCGGESFDADSR